MYDSTAIFLGPNDERHGDFEIGDRVVILDNYYSSLGSPYPSLQPGSKGIVVALNNAISVRTDIEPHTDLLTGGWSFYAHELAHDHE